MIPHGPRLAHAAEALFSARIIHLPCHTSENSPPSSRRTALASCKVSPRSLSVTATGGFLVLVVAQGQQPPSIRVGRLDRTRPIPYASLTLSGSREGKRTHLCFGESNSCPGTVRSFPQSRGQDSTDSSSSLLSQLVADSSWRFRLSLTPKPAYSVDLLCQSLSSAPSGGTPFSRYFHKATSSFRAKATMPIRRSRLPPCAKPPLVPAAQRALRLKAQPAPGNLDRHRPHPPVARLADPLFVIQAAAAIRAARQSHDRPHLPPILDPPPAEYLPHVKPGTVHADAFQPQQLTHLLHRRIVRIVGESAAHAPAPSARI